MILNSLLIFSLYVSIIFIQYKNLVIINKKFGIIKIKLNLSIFLIVLKNIIEQLNFKKITIKMQIETN